MNWGDDREIRRQPRPQEKTGSKNARWRQSYFKVEIEKLDEIEGGRESGKGKSPHKSLFEMDAA